VGRRGWKGGEHADVLTRRELAKATVKAGLAASAEVWVAPQMSSVAPRANDSGESSTVGNDDRFDNEFDDESDNGCDDDATDDSIEEGTADAEEGTAESAAVGDPGGEAGRTEAERRPPWGG